MSSTIDLLRTDLTQEKKVMIDVAATDPPLPIEEANGPYAERRKRIRQLCKQLKVEHPNPWSDLWLWHNFWSVHLPTWKSRRVYVIEMYQPLLDKLDEMEEQTLSGGLDLGETGWDKVDLQMAQLRERHRTASTTEDFKAVGLLCRSILLSLSDVVFDPEQHQPVHGPKIKDDDFKNKVDQVLSVDFSGKDYEVLRRLMKATWRCACELSHSETADYTTMVLAANSVLHTAQTLRILIPREVVEDVDEGLAELPGIER